MLDAYFPVYGFYNPDTKVKVELRLGDVDFDTTPETIYSTELLIESPYGSLRSQDLDTTNVITDLLLIVRDETWPDPPGSGDRILEKYTRRVKNNTIVIEYTGASGEILSFSGGGAGSMKGTKEQLLSVLNHSMTKNAISGALSRHTWGKSRREEITASQTN